jgi:pimeloyl-ACP methyl ester carboxylesterase
MTDSAQQPDEILSLDHYVDSVSRSATLGAMPIRLFLRERVAKAGAPPQPGAKPVLFVHGGTYPGVPDFDLPFRDYSWMAYLARLGFDAYAVDLTGYGRSSRPHMDDPCNVLADDQPLIGLERRPPSFPHPVASLQSDWGDIDAAVEFIRGRTGVAAVDMVGWSGGGPRVGGYAALHPQKVGRVVLLAPAYIPVTPTPPPDPGAPTAIITREGAMARWDAQVACEDQYDPAIRDAIWRSNLEMDPTGAGWGPGVVRRPTTSDRFRWPAELVARFKAPTLMLAGELDVEVKPEQVRRLYDDMGADDKVLVNLACGSHYVVYERVHQVLFEASRDWLATGRYRGETRAVFDLDRDGRPRPAA